MVYDSRGTSPVHVDQVLTQISVGWPNGGMLGPVFFPAVRVAKQSDKYYVFGRESWGVFPGGDYRAPGTVANEIPGLNVSTDSYFAIEHSLQIPITDEEKENADAPLDPFRDGTELVTSKLLLARELAIKTKMTTASNYAAGLSVTLSGTSQFNDYTNSDPIGVIKTGRRAVHDQIFMDPNVIAIPYQVMTQLEDHPDFIERIKYSQRGIVTDELIAALIGIPRIVTAGAGYNSANPGQAASLGYIWGKDIVMAYVPDRPGLKTPAFGYEFVWRYPGGGEQVTDRWREEQRKSDLVRVSRRYDLKFVAKNASDKAIAGYVIKAAVA